MSLWLQYVNNYDQASRTFETLTDDNSKFRAFCEHRSAHSKANLPLMSYLIMPIQRM